MNCINKFYVDYKNHKIIGDLIGNKNHKNIFFLHGAGHSNRKRFEPLRELFYKNGFSSCAFDFIGHGETGGLLSESSLFERTKQVCTVIDYMKNDEPLTIIAASMSGYTAVKLLESYNVDNIILFVPAAYDKDAYMLPFNHKFTDCIRKDRSYKNSDAWQILNEFTGNLIIIKAENDTVIPDEVINDYYESAFNAKTRKIITIKNSPHGVLNYLSEHEEQLKNTVDEIIKIINVK
ncbi:alpha/beta hydrolase [Clostridium ganghwense]|uniref:Alpha/beta hydrolase n=1 Tax=Clostridium ganghwense TaxID=312089 RepID=A0ABT4CQZ9_9CLOT|nr:alpha/beta hydrolase [Clostridium ganghwense]MCY6371472.1 alpha/beta hydrolase [Clostridium ganghwense]